MRRRPWLTQTVELLLIVLLGVLIAITLGLHEKRDADSAGIHYLIGQEKVHSVSWDHCPGGSGNPHTQTVSDPDFAVFQVKYATQLAAYPANCP